MWVVIKCVNITLLTSSCSALVGAQVGGLRPGRGYSFRVRAQNTQGQGPWSQPLQASTAADVPGPPPQPVCSKRTAAGVTVKWEAPEQEHGAPVVSYRCVCLTVDNVMHFDNVLF